MLFIISYLPKPQADQYVCAIRHFHFSDVTHVRQTHGSSSSQQKINEKFFSTISNEIFTSFNDGSWSLFFHFNSILIFVHYDALAMTEMKCSILGHVHIYTSTDVCVCRKLKERGKIERTSASEILSPPFPLAFILECQSARLCVYKCIQFNEQMREREEGERTNDERFRSQLVLCVKLGLYGYI